MKTIVALTIIFVVSLFPLSAFGATGGDSCSSVGLVQYRPSGSCDTAQRTCCRNGYYSVWGSNCSGADNCTSSQVWNGSSCVIDCSVPSIKAANKAYCCASVAESDDTCYKDCYKWTIRGSGTQNCYYQPTTMYGCQVGEIYYNGPYCLHGCKDNIELLSSLPCVSATEGSECSASDYRNYPYEGLKAMGPPCSQMKGEEYYYYGWDKWITVVRVNEFFCSKTRCKNGW